MSRKLRRGAGIGVAGLVVAMVVMVGLAWACTPQATINASIDRAGSVVLLEGNHFSENTTIPLYVKTGSGTRIAQLGEVFTDDGTFSKRFTIPTLPPGVYYFLAEGTDTSDGRIYRPSAAFEVNAGSATTQASQPAAATAPAVANTTTPATSSARESAASASGVAKAADTPSTRTVQRIQDRPGSSSLTAPAEPTSVVAAPEAPAADVAVAPVPSRKSVTGDLWSGLASAARSTAGPGFDEPQAAPSGTPAGLLAGVILLASGTVALMAGFTVTQLRRRARSAGRASEDEIS